MNRTKVTVACQACQKKKVKCTGSSPCANCSRSGHSCIFSNTAKKRGPRNGNVEVIKSSAHRIEYVLQNYPSLRDQIEQMLDGKNESSNNNKPSRNIHPMRLQSLIGSPLPKSHVIVDDDKNKTKNIGLSSFPYLVPTKSVHRQDDITIRNHVIPRSDINRYAQASPLTSQSKITELATLINKPPSLPPFSSIMEEVSSKDEGPDDENDLTLPTPHNMFQRKAMAMSIYSTSLGTQLFLPASADNSLDDLQKSLISSSYQQNPEGTLPLNDKNSPEHGRILAGLNEMFRSENTCTRISLPSPPSHFSLSSSPRSTCTNYPPTPTSSVSPPPSPHIKSKRSSIHLLSKPAPWCANVINEDREDRSLWYNRSHFQPNHLMETDAFLVKSVRNIPELFKPALIILIISGSINIIFGFAVIIHQRYYNPAFLGWFKDHHRFAAVITVFSAINIQALKVVSSNFGGMDIYSARYSANVQRAIAWVGVLNFGFQDIPQLVILVKYWNLTEGYTFIPFMNLILNVVILFIDFFGRIYDAVIITNDEDGTTRNLNNRSADSTQQYSMRVGAP
ncbi:17335_t:CDS:2 [Funneliformis geosporum]|uniref:17335_t:CDS:1 n=1 Tax=Funneliformis geosporum TaxID=1117311 RepID=A0A9W4WNV9_9GLOM|nr:17335_t:CDS:2 [Funneliformis geosporum]